MPADAASDWIVSQGIMRFLYPFLQLLRPPKSVERGVHEGHYMQLRSAEEVRSIAAEADIRLSEDQFEAVFRIAAQADDEEGKCCLDTFFRARHHVLSQQA